MSAFDKHTCESHYYVEVDLGSGWTFCVEDDEIKLFETKDEAKKFRKELVAKLKSGRN